MMTAKRDAACRLEEEQRRREEEERLRWMRETQERRRLVREHMANLKKQRALDAERAAMAREEVLTQTFAQEERRCDADDGPSWSVTIDCFVAI